MNKKFSSSSLSSFSSNISRRKAKQNLDRNARRKRGRKKQRVSSGYSLDYQNLEERLPLDASFTYNDGGGTLNLTNFDLNGASNVTLINDGTTFTAVLDVGNWLGQDPTDDFDDMGQIIPENVDIMGIGSNTLTLPNEFFNALTVSGLGANTLTFGESNFGNGQSVNIDSNTSFIVDQNIPSTAPTDLGNFPSGTPVTIDTVGSNFDTELALFDINGILLAENDDAVGLQSLLTPGALADGTYFIALGGFSSTFADGFVATGGGSDGAFALNLDGTEVSNGGLTPNQIVFFSFNVGTGPTQTPAITPAIPLQGVPQLASLDLDNLSVSGNGTLSLESPGNRFSTLNVDVNGSASVVSQTGIQGNNFSGSDVTIVVSGGPTPNATYDTISAIGAINIALDGNLTVNDSISALGSIQIVTGGTTSLGNAGTSATESIDIDAISISTGNITTAFTSVASDINSLGVAPFSSIRLRATGGASVIGVPGSDTPILRDNTAGDIVITGTVVADQVLLQSSNGVTIPVNNLDTFQLFLGGDLEVESRGEFQLNVPSLQQLSVNLFDGFAITSQQDVTVGDFAYTGVDDADPLTTDDEFDDQIFTAAYSDLYSNITATSLLFDSPFQSQKLVADITTDIEQNPGAILEIDDLYLIAKRVVLDNVDNDFQRIAAVGEGFLADQRQNDEDILTIRDRGTLEIAVLDSQPDDTLVVNFSAAITQPTLAGIRIDGIVDIQTGLGGPAPVQLVDAVEPTSEQLGNTVDNPNQFQIETFEIPRDRTGTQTGVFRDDAYNGSVRPVYFIEFAYDGTQDLRIETDQFERGNPELVRSLIDIELALYDSAGRIVALGDDITGILDRIEFAAGTLPAGRYFVAASAFSTEFEDDFVVRTSNVQTGTLNVTITGNIAVTPETSRDLTQAVGAPLIVVGGDEFIPDDELFEEDPDDFTPDNLILLDPDADDFVPERRRRDPIGDLLPEEDGRATLGAANGGSVQLGLVDDNDIRELVVNGAETVEFVDTNDLTVTNLNTPGQSRLAAGRGGDGGLTVGDIAAPTLLLQASSGVTQEGVLTVNELLLGGDLAIDGGGDFVILSDTLENLAFNLPAGNLALTTSQELTLTFAQYSDPDNLLAPRFIFNNSTVSGTARIEAASINVNTRVEAETIVLDVTDSITQAPAVDLPLNFDPDLVPTIPALVATSLSVSATTVTLDQIGNDITRLAGNVTGTGDAFSLDNRGQVVFSTIDNTIEAITRLRPIGVTQNFGPLTTINGLTVAGLANIISGTESDDPTATSPLAVVTINPIVVSNDDGSNTAEFFGNAAQEAEIKQLIDEIYLTAGVDIEFLPTQFYNSTFANIGDGTMGPNGERPQGDLFTIIQAGDAAGVGSPDPLVIDLYAVSINPGFPPAIGLAFVGAPGTTIQVGDGNPTTENGRIRTSVLTAHEIGHNLGLGHVVDTPGNLLSPVIFTSPPAFLNAEQAVIVQASPLSSEPVAIFGGFTQEDGASLNIGTANFTVRGDGDITLLDPENDVTFVGTDARDVSVTLVDESTVVSITANRNLSIEGVGSLTVENANSVDGSVTINAVDDVLIGSIETNAGIAADGTISITAANGSINDLQNDSLADFTATGTITLSANTEIGSVDNRLDFADLAVVDATSATSDIVLEGLGALTLQDFEATVGAVDVVAGDVLVGAVFAGETIDVNSADGINDLQDDLIADFTASGLVNLVAVNEIGGMASPQVVDTSGRLEAAVGTLISTTTTGGGVSVGGDGDLNFQNLITPNAVDISTTGDLTIENLMAFSATLNANNLTVDTTKTVDFVDFTSLGIMDLGTVMATAITLNSGETLDATSLMASTGDIIVNSTGDANIGEITADLANVIVDSSTDLTTGTTTATNGSVQLTAQNTLTSSAVIAQADATLSADVIVADTVVAGGIASLTASMNIDAGSITGSSATLDAGGTLIANAVTATVGAATLTAGVINATSVTAQTDATLTSITGDITVVDVTAVTGISTINTAQNLTVTGTISGQDISLTVPGVTDVEAIDIAGRFELIGDGPIGIRNITAGSASIEATDLFDLVSLTTTVGDAEITANNINIQTVDAAQNALLTTTLGDLVATQVTAGGTAQLNSAANLNVDSINGQAANLSAVGTTLINLIETTETTTLDSVGDATVLDIEAGSVFLTSQSALTTPDVTATTGDAFLTAGTNLISGDVTAVGLAELNSGGLLDSETVTAGSVSLISDDSIESVNVTANVGDVVFTALETITAATVVAENAASLTAIRGNITITDSITSATDTISLFSGANVDVAELDSVAIVVDATGDVTFTDIDVVDVVNISSRRSIETDSVIGSSVTLDAATTLSAGIVTARTGDVSLIGQESVTATIVTANSGIASLESGGSLIADSVDAVSVTTNSAGNTNVTEITADEALTIDSGGTLAVTTTNAGSAAIEAVDNVTLETLNTTDDASLISSAGKITADTIASTAGAVSLTAAQQINAQSVSGALDVTFDARNQINSTSVVSTAGSVDLLSNSNISVNTVVAAADATVNAPRSNVFAESVTAGNAANLNAGAFLFTRSVEASTATLSAGTNQVAHRVLANTATITADLDLRLNDIEAQTLTLVAGDDILDIAFGDGRGVKTSDLTLVAGNSVDELTFGGIVLETDVDTLSATVEGTGFGNIIIRELDAVQLGTITAGNGRIFVAANGTISGGDISTITQNNNNDVRLDAVGDTSDVNVRSIDVGALGDVTLLAGDDVIIPDAGAVTADYVFALARNRSVGGEDGIRLGTDIVRTDLVVGLADDADQLPGDIVIQDTGSFTLNFARTLSGTISATANGNLIANVAQAEGVTADDSIHLKAVGSGSDVVTGRVVVRNQTGGVLIEADDDIREGNTGDNLQVIADSATYVAGNNLNDIFNGIIGQSRVRTLSARVDGTSEANIFLFNQGNARLNEAVLSSGTISVTNRLGGLIVDRAETTSDSIDNVVQLTTTGSNSDLILADVSAGSRGRVDLDSADDIFDTDALDDLFVTGGFLSATSRNGSVDPFDGIILNVDVDRFVADAQSGGVEAIRNRRV